MKKRYLTFLVISLFLTLVSCKKEKGPQVKVDVVDELNNPVNGAIVRTSVRGVNESLIDARVLQEGRTDNFGNITFTFENSVLIDIALYDNNNTILDSASVFAETKRKRGRTDNIYRTKLVVR